MVQNCSVFFLSLSSVELLLWLRQTFQPPSLPGLSWKSAVHWWKDHYIWSSSVSGILTSLINWSNSTWKFAGVFAPTSTRRLSDSTFLFIHIYFCFFSLSLSFIKVLGCFLLLLLLFFPPVTFMVHKQIQDHYIRLFKPDPPNLFLHNRISISPLEFLPPPAPVWNQLFWMPQLYTILCITSALVNHILLEMLHFIMPNITSTFFILVTAIVLMWSANEIKCTFLSVETLQLIAEISVNNPHLCSLSFILLKCIPLLLLQLSVLSVWCSEPPLCWWKYWRLGSRQIPEKFNLQSLSSPTPPLWEQPDLISLSASPLCIP